MKVLLLPLQIQFFSLNSQFSPKTQYVQGPIDISHQQEILHG